MSRVSTIFIALALLGTSAWAASWSDYQSAFPAFPCQDGWMACRVDGTLVNPELAKDSAGRPTPTDLRVGWDLKPTATFSPFAKLSAYVGGEVKTVAAATPPVEAVEAPEVAPTEATDPPEVVADPPVVANNTKSEPSRETHTTSPTKPVDKPASKPENTSTKMSEPSTTSGHGERPRNPTTPVTPPVTPVMIAPSKQADAGKAMGDTCTDLVTLEKQAILGKMTDGQMGCLEKSYSGSGKQTEKDKVSRLLMANAYGKGDLKAWEKLVKRHLEEIDQSDPDLCYKYAQHLAKGGAGRAMGVIKWANVALENRTAWSGTTYKDRVFGLYKLRATAAQSMWQSNEEEFAKNPTDEALKKKVDDTRNSTKVFAREWYEYSKEAGKDTTKALQMCTSAAGTASYCEGGG